MPCPRLHEKKRIHAQLHANVLGKKILEWHRDAKKAYQTALYLNNRYFLDGRDPNSYAGVGWIFGLKRKCNIEGYIQRVEELVRKEKKRPPAAKAEPLDPSLRMLPAFVPQADHIR